MANRIIINPLDPWEGSFEDLFHVEVSEPKWIISPVVPYAGKMFLFGETGAGKTQVAIDLMMSFVNGSDWLGKYPCEQGKVLYISLEDLGTTELIDKVTAALQFMPTEQRVNIRGMLEHVGFDIFSPSDPVRQKIARICDAHKPVAVVVDPISASIGRYTMNDIGVARPMWGAWREVIGGAMICGIHHEKQINPNPNFTTPEIDMAAGPKEWLNFVNLGVRVSTVKNTYGRNTAKKRISFPKVRNAPEADHKAIEFFLDSDTVLPQLVSKSSEHDAVKRYMAAGMPREIIKTKLVDGTFGRVVPEGTWKPWLRGYHE